MTKYIENIDVDKAIELFKDLWGTQMNTEVVDVSESIHRVLASDYSAVENIPLVRASMMDGIAVKSQMWMDGKRPDTGNWKMGEEFIRADTGDDFDDDYDTVIPIEKVEIGENGLGIKLDESLEFTKGMNIRGSGSNIKKDTELLKSGHRINATDLAVLCMGNIDKVAVRKKPIVAFIPTGTELINVGEKITRGKNIDSNSLMAKHLLEEFGAEVVLYPITPDDPESIKSILKEALEVSDMVLINGGSSKGEEDFGPRLLNEMGKLYFHWAQSGPGRPVAMASVSEKPVFIVPGPTYGCLNVLQWLIRPCLQHWLAYSNAHYYKTTARLKETADVPTRFKFLVGVELEWKDGELWATLLNFKRHGTVRCLKADGFVHSGEWLENTKVGDEVVVKLLRPI